MSWLVVRGARHNNLKNIDVSIPLGRFTCVTGVSGSGKSSLVNDILYKALARALNEAFTIEPGAHDGIDGLEHLEKVIAIDQTPIGRTPRSNPATYVKLFDEIRDLFTRLPDAKLRGYLPGRFSFNVPARRGGGRCEACEGNGANRIEMDFLADVWVTCPICEGRRFTRETLQIHFKGKSISDVLNMEVQEALVHFDAVPRIRGMLQTLEDVGLDYIQLGQPSPTLSGGEAQRIKLARELVKRGNERTLYVLDEPTTGLHFADIRKLLAVLHGFVDRGSTVVVIEHNLDVIKTADWIIDLGPEGGEAGGRIVVEGTPEDVAACATSETGKALREVLEGSVGVPPAVVARTDSRTSAAFDVREVTVVGAAQHNLKDITVSFPRNQITVCTGVSGSGKTSFAIDTVFTEGYRRYVESLSAYARQFLGQMAKPKVEQVHGLSPAICIEQHSAGRSPRSTVGTVTEIYDYLRVLWARLGTRYCPKCDVPIGSQTVDEIVDRVLGLGDGVPVIILAPVSLGSGESYGALFQRLKSSGYTRVRIDGEIRQTAQATTLDARQKHRVEVVVDRTVVRKRSRGRLAESIEHALALGNGLTTLVVEAVETVPEETAEDSVGGPPDIAARGDCRTSADLPSAGGAGVPPPGVPGIARELLFSQKLACVRCGVSYEELGPHHFSFNSPLGWCETCEGLGVQRGAPAATIIARPGRSLLDGALDGWPRIDRKSPLGRILVSLCEQLGVAADTPLRDWTPDQKRTLLFGADSGRGGTGAAGTTRPDPAAAGSGWLAVDQAFPGVRVQWRGLFPTIDQATRNSWSFRHKLRHIVTEIPCTTCRGGRLRPDASAVRLGGRTLIEIAEMPLRETAEFFRRLKLDERERRIAGELLKEVRDRLQFLVDVGLHYLTLHRPAPTLSGGEAQRIRLASQIGSGLSGVLYVLDEPTIGLHPRDTGLLIAALRKLRDLGNTLLLVEHDRAVIAEADRLLDFGPGAGAGGGQIVAQGPVRQLLPHHCPPVAARQRTGAADDSAGAECGAPGSESLTTAFLSGRRSIPIPTNRRLVAVADVCALVASPSHSDHDQQCRAKTRAGSRPTARRGPKTPTERLERLGAVGRTVKSAHEEGSQFLVVRGARHNNLKNITVAIPLGRLVCVTGVSGSGKSSLVHDILWPYLSNLINRASLPVGDHDAIEVVPEPNPRRIDRVIDGVINVDQSPIGATPSSNPATYTGVFDQIRELFARLPESKMRGYTANRFSFNRPGGRCEACEGYGQRRIEMHFMPDVWIECETCQGRRYNRETLDSRFKGKTIADVLDARVAEARALFVNVPRVRRMLDTLADVGLDYVQLGQPAPTLSGGEAQRVKLAAELGKPNTGRTLYILDEPTTGLHFEDIRKLLAVLQRLVDLGNTVLVVEHNLDLIKCADWIIDLGPEAGDEGGYVVAAGTPEDLAEPNRARSARASGPLDPNRAGQEAPASAHAPTRPSGEPISHTARALAPILAAGPYEERCVYSAEQHAAQELDVAREGFGDVGRDTRMPWQIDGRKWHLEQRTSRGESPRQWEPRALELVLKLVQEAGRAHAPGFEPTNWSNRASVEITAPGAMQWFLHALTGGEWLLELYFMVPAGTFDWRVLNAELGLKTLDERTDLQTYGDWARVDVRPRYGGYEAVVIYVHDRAEIDNPAFRKFIRRAVKAYFQGV